MLLDHIVVGASSLSAGLAQCETLSGIDIPLGGQHEMMATHNALMSFGDRSYFELIAVDPSQQAPRRPTWFSFNREATQERLAQGIAPLTWVVATDNIERIVKESPIPLGEIVTMQRGDLQWKLTIRPDGALPEYGMVPSFIQWPNGVHPTQKMQDKGVRLQKISLTHPESEPFAVILKELGVREMVELHHGPHRIRFEMSTPTGEWIIDGPVF